MTVREVIKIDNGRQLRYVATVHQQEQEDIMGKPDIIRELKRVADGQQRSVTVKDSLNRAPKRAVVSKREAKRILEVYRRLPKETALKFADYGYPMMLVVLPQLEKIGRSR